MENPNLGRMKQADQAALEKEEMKKNAPPTPEQISRGLEQLGVAITLQAKYEMAIDKIADLARQGDHDAQEGYAALKLLFGGAAPTDTKPELFGKRRLGDVAEAALEKYSNSDNQG